MERRQRFFIAIVACVSLLTTPALGESFKEAATGIEFAAETSDGLALLGTGVRKKLVFNVYAAALYVDLEGFVEAIGEKGTSEANRVVHRSGIRRRMILHFVRNVPAAKIRAAFRYSLEANMSAKDYAAESGKIETFLASCTDVNKGDLFLFESKGDRVKVKLRGQTIFKAGSRRLMRGMWGSYFGKSPINEKLRQGLLRRSGEFLGDK
jgi:hypothetical protein